MDSFIVSARKYRPTTFSAVVGQDNIVKTLKNAIINKHLAQAFLFTGPRGVGKTTCARILAKTINCTNISKDGEACNECNSCKSFNESASFNIHELDAASNNSVEDIRSLVEQVRVPPQDGKFKIYIIDEVHMLSQNAFNAFLKTLEEPPAYAKFILATTERHKIIPTILSRCQIYNFKRISADDIAKHLAHVAESENITAEQDALLIIAQKADGALRDALSIFDQMVTFSGKNITYRSVIENLNILDYDNYFQLTDNFIAGDYKNALITLNNIIYSGFDGQHIISGLSNHIRNLLISKENSTLEILEAGEQMAKRYTDQAKRSPERFLVSALDMLTNAEFNYRQSNIKGLFLENLILQLCFIISKIEDQDELKKKITTKKKAETPSDDNEIPQPIISKNTVENETKKDIPQPNKIRVTALFDELKKEHKKEHHHETFDQKRLIDAWGIYCSSIKTSKINLHTILVNSAIAKIEENKIEVIVDGPMKKAEIEAEKMDIVQSLRDILKNDDLDIVVKMVEKTNITDQHTLFANEKLNEVIRKYPSLSLFVETLKLNPEL